MKKDHKVSVFNTQGEMILDGADTPIKARLGDYKRIVYELGKRLEQRFKIRNINGARDHSEATIQIDSVYDSGAVFHFVLKVEAV